MIMQFLDNIRGGDDYTFPQFVAPSTVSFTVPHGEVDCVAHCLSQRAALHLSFLPSAVTRRRSRRALKSPTRVRSVIIARG